MDNTVLNFLLQCVVVSYAAPMQYTGQFNRGPYTVACNLSKVDNQQEVSCSCKGNFVLGTFFL